MEAVHRHAMRAGRARATAVPIAVSGNRGGWAVEVDEGPEKRTVIFDHQQSVKLSELSRLTSGPSTDKRLVLATLLLKLVAQPVRQASGRAAGLHRVRCSAIPAAVASAASQPLRNLD